MSYAKRSSRFLQGLGQYRVRSSITPAAIEAFLASLDSPRSLAVWLLFREGEHQQLVDLETDPLNYEDSESFMSAYVATELLSKAKFLTLQVDLKEVALKKFRLSETSCKAVNSRFKYGGSSGLTPRAVWLHNAITRKIAAILGEIDEEELFSLANWGPGASTLIKRREASSPAKFQLETGITRDLFSQFFTRMTYEYPLWGNRLSQLEMSIQVGNRVTTVPKNAKTDRVIAIEPGFNLWFQKAVGELIKRRLRKCGIDLRYQSRNQALARKGSVSGKLGTIDLSSASDTISTELVRDLLPPAWFDVMDTCRSHYGQLDGELVKWEKFSSMGNGFTFPLQSLLFYATAFCCAELAGCETRDVSVYGDDIIIPVDAFELFSEMMLAYGFSLNTKKSFISSRFRESCGSHYYGGSDCKPIYLKDRLQTVTDVYRLANAVRWFAHRQAGNMACDGRFKELHSFLVRSVPSLFRLRIPASLGDGGFISNFDEARVHVTPGNYLEGYVVRHVYDAPRKRELQHLGVLFSKLWALELQGQISDPDDPVTSYSRILSVFTRMGGRRETASLVGVHRIGVLRPDDKGGGNLIPLSGQTSIALAETLVSQWYELGPWV